MAVADEAHGCTGGKGRGAKFQGTPDKIKETKLTSHMESALAQRQYKGGKKIILGDVVVVVFVWWWWGGGGVAGDYRKIVLWIK